MRVQARSMWTYARDAWGPLGATAPGAGRTVQAMRFGSVQGKAAPARDGDPRARARHRRRSEPRGRFRRIRQLSVAIAAVAFAAAALLLLPAPDHDGVTKAVARIRPLLPVRLATVTVSAGRGVKAVPRSYLGLSMEYWSVPRFQRYPSLFDQVLSLVRSPGDGPVILRVGGDSADRTFLQADVRRAARWMFEVNPAWFRALRSVVRATGARVIVDLNLITGSASMAAQWAGEAEAILPPGSIAGFEVGNEPDIYSHRFWARAISSGGDRFWARTVSSGRVDAGMLPRRLRPSTYDQQFQAYASALSQVAPAVPLFGPVIANPRRSLRWVSTLLAHPHPGLGVIDVHRYPYTACGRRTSPAYATIARVLSENASAGVARSVTPALRLAHRAGLPLRVTELGSVTCGGRPGVSNTFATALWAPDTLFELLRAGVSGVNVHVRENAINAAFLMSRHGLRARPLLYGIALFARSLGPGAHLLHTHVRARPSLNLKAWTVRLRGATLHVVLIDKGPHPVRVDLRLPGVGPAIVQRLIAPSVRSRSGVTLAGQWLGSDGRWQGKRVTDSVARSGRSYELLVPRYSAALVTIRTHAGGRPRTRRYGPRVRLNPRARGHSPTTATRRV